MEDFTVDLEGLGALGSNLDRGSEQLDGALRAMRDVGPAPLGTDDLDRACADFHGSWSHGLGKLGECVGKVRTGIDGTAASYAELEQALTVAFARMKDALGQGS